MILNDLTRVTDSSPSGMKFCAAPRQLVLYYLVLMLSVYFAWGVVASPAAELKVRRVGPSPPVDPAPDKPDQLPLSRVARGYHDIISAWLARPTKPFRVSRPAKSTS